jgi:hypothetical protein
MIKIDYSEGNIKMNTSDLRGIFKSEQLPLKFKIKKVVSKEVIWETNLNSNMWAIFPSNEINDVVVEDAQGNFIYQYYWDVLQHGSVFYKSLWMYCKGLINDGKKPKGLVVGTHDGEFGEWVPLVKNFMSDMLLVEGSEKQFNKLSQNFKGKQGVSFLNELITTDGSEVEFFEGGAGYTNSIVKRVIDHWETEEIHSSKRKSTSINNLIKNNLGGKVDWIHLDVEGLDAKLLMSLNEEYIPNFIIFEDFNLLVDEKQEIIDWFSLRGFNLYSEGGICMAKK